MLPVLRLIRSGCLGFCVVLLALGSQALAQPTSSPIPREAGSVRIGGFPFPSNIAGLSRISKTDYNSPGLGFSVRYRGIDDTWADIYIYDLGQDLTSGPALSHAKGELLSALKDIDTGVSRGAYQRAEVLDRSQDRWFAKAHLRIAQAGTTRDSYVFVAVRNRNFVKIRLTSGDRRHADRIAKRFLAEYGAALGRTEEAGL